MLKLIEIVSSYTSQAQHTLTLPYDRRIISRQRVHLDQGGEAGLFLERGVSLQHGDVLKADSGELVSIQAALETVSSLYCSDPLLFARACYHLGNRHVALEIRAGRLRYLHDHVLDDMLLGLGLKVVVEQASFEPEAGAYSSTGHSHAHSHSAATHHHD